MRIDTHDFNPPKISDLVVEGTYSIAIGGKIHISANINDDVEVQKVELTLTNENGVIVESRKARLRYPVDYIDAETDGCGTNCGVADPFAGSVYIEETFDALPVGKFKVAIIATDNKGLLGKKSREVLLEDTNSPVIGYISTSYAKYPYTYLFPKSDEFIAGKTFTVSGEITDDVMVKSAVVIIRNSGGEIVKKTDAKLNYLQDECCCEGDNCGCAISPPDERRAYFKEKFTLETLGVYTVEVTSTDNEGLTDKKTKNITIIEDNTLQIDRVQIDVVSNGSAIKVFAEISDDDIRVESANITLKDSQGQVVDSIVANVQFYMESGCEEYPDGSFNCDGSPLYTDAYIKETFTDVLPGSYTVEIVATDNEGNSDREIKAITILEISDFNVVYNKEEKSITVDGSVFCDDCENVRVTIDLYYGDLGEVIEDVDTMLVENGQHGFRLDFSGVSYRKGPGKYIITATAIAKDGTRSTKTKKVFLDYENVAPKFNSFSVSAPSVSGSFNVTGEVTDSDGEVKSVGLVIKTLGGTVIKSLADLNLEMVHHGNDDGSGFIHRFNETIENIPPGEYIAEATVSDYDDATAVESVTIKIDGSSEPIPPEIEKLEVTVDSETGLVEVTGTATDNNGERGGHVDAISLTLKSSGGDIIKQVDTLPAILCSSQAPGESGGECFNYWAEFTEVFENIPDGSYSIEAVVTDIDGLTGSALKYFSVGQQIDTVDIEVKAVDTDTVFVENDAVLHEFTISNKGNIDANEVDVVIDIENGTLAAEQSDGCSKITSTRLKCTIDQLAYDSPEILEVAIIVNYIVGDDQFLKTTATATAKELDINPDNNSAYTANPIQDEPGTEGIKEEPKDGLGGSLDSLLAIIALLGLFGVRRRRK
ncbi:MAG: hypothetical protein D6B27_02875 [Gammaproteobacteria bacterium]|nr:MAG: hypothetical protein D6B27_02875 [Gammaproteobacteria bacterium]